MIFEKRDMSIFSSLLKRSWLLVPILLVSVQSGCASLPGGGERRTTDAQAEDQVIEQKASARLRERFGGERSISTLIVSFNRTALITGFAPDAATKLEIGETVAKIENVRQVVNEVQLSYPTGASTHTQDAYLATRINLTLSDQGFTSANAIKVHTFASAVYLMGLVTEREANVASVIASRVPGVRWVVRAFEIISESQLAAINSALSIQNNRTDATSPVQRSTPNRPTNAESQTVYKEENEELKQRLEEQRKQQVQAIANAEARANAEIARVKAEADALKAQAPQATQNLNYAAINSAHALVIGNSSYAGSASLANPVNDAKAISKKLRSLGFKVTEVIDASRAQMVRSLSKFSETSEKADVTLLFYAGHGVQISGINYMIPVDTNLGDISEATLQAISLNSVVERYLPGKTKLVFLDACRDNPLMTASSRGVTRGLAPINVSEGTLISYATKDGQTAADGTGQKNSPYTAALLEHLGDPQDIGIVLRTVRAKVMQRTNNRQQPWEYGSLTGGALVLSTLKN